MRNTIKYGLLKYSYITFKSYFYWKCASTLVLGAVLALCLLSVWICSHTTNMHKFPLK